MKKLSLILLLVAFYSCKKDKTQPTPDPTPVECKTGATNFDGKYKDASDSVTITWVSNRCPEENANNYKSDDLWMLLNKYAVSGYTFTPQTFTFSSTSDSELKYGTGILDPLFSITIINSNAIRINSPKTTQAITFPR